jgi:hypothetical protein
MVGGKHTGRSVLQGDAEASLEMYWSKIQAQGMWGDPGDICTGVSQALELLLGNHLVVKATAPPPPSEPIARWVCTHSTGSPFSHRSPPCQDGGSLMSKVQYGFKSFLEFQTVFRASLTWSHSTPVCPAYLQLQTLAPDIEAAKPHWPVLPAVHVIKPNPLPRVSPGGSDSLWTLTQTFLRGMACR